MINSELINSLNVLYKPLYETVKDLRKQLKEKLGLESVWGYFGQHYLKNGDDWVTEYFPIPVITVNNLCEIGYDIGDQIFVEAKMSREKALKFDFTSLGSYAFELYGVDEYLTDFFNDDMDFEGIHQRIENSKEKLITVCFYFSLDTSVKEIVDTVKLIQSF